MLWQSVLTMMGAYLLGSVPSAYIAGRLLKGVDIRDYGSGNVGGSNVWRQVARWAIVPVALADIGKGALPVLVAQRLELGLAVQVLAGVAAIVGHNWSLYLRFSGGRGIGTIGGMLAVLAPQEFVVVALIALLGVVFRNVPVGVGLGVVFVPVAMWVFHEPFVVTLGGVAIVSLVAAKRLMGNPGQRPVEVSRWERFFNRLLLDRDIRDREAWVSREPVFGAEPCEEGDRR